MMRSHRCGELRAEHIGQDVELAGWAWRQRDHGGLVFVDLRDSSGLAQVVISPEVAGDIHNHAHAIRNEYVLRVKGRVRRRPEGTANPNLPTGEVEIEVHRLEILNECKTLPFLIDEGPEPSENLRFRHRYLDLRRPSVQNHLVARNRIVSHIRSFLDHEGFIDVETPVLNRSTPEGARDYLVPSRVNPGSFYALPQSPQLFKQILMVAGFDRYYQIVKCFRDEDLRADRQPEFTQVDLEMSFVSEEDVMGLTEAMIRHVFRQLLEKEIGEIPRLPFRDALERFGSDKPDLRFGLELRDMADLVRNSSFKVFLDTLGRGGRVKAICVPGISGYSRKDMDVLTEEAQGYGAKGLAWIRVKDTGFESPIAKFFPEETLKAMAARMEATAGDTMLFVADQPAVVAETLSRLRGSLARRLGLIPEGEYRFAWVTEFPLLEWDEELGRHQAMHHPFTAPVDEDLERLESGRREDLDAVRARAYDLVLNGFEVGGGSIRVHRADVQERMLGVLRIGPEEARDKFGFLLEAL
ncbi:MAG: aspartate--tRNA ligase, partial [Thermodesulfobacteriota bacterium]